MPEPPQRGEVTGRIGVYRIALFRRRVRFSRSEEIEDAQKTESAGKKTGLSPEPKTASDKALTRHLTAVKSEVAGLAGDITEIGKKAADELAALKKEAERLSAEKSAAEKNAALELSAAKSEVERLTAEIANSERKSAAELAALKAEAERLTAEKAAAEKAPRKELLEIKAEVEKLTEQVFRNCKPMVEELEALKAEAKRLKSEKNLDGKALEKDFDVTISMHDASVGVFIPHLVSLSGLLDKGAAYAEARKFDAANLLAMRLAPNMYDLAQQAGERYAKLAALHARRFIEHEPYPAWVLNDRQVWWPLNIEM